MEMGNGVEHTSLFQLYPHKVVRCKALGGPRGEGHTICICRIEIRLDGSGIEAVGE